MAHLTDVTPVKVNIEARDPTATAIDPVCGMKVERRSSRFMAFRGDQTLYFCSRECKEKFAPPQ